MHAGAGNGARRLLGNGRKPQELISHAWRQFTRTEHTSANLQRKRVLGAIAHINSGKTTTSEAMLYKAGALRRMGNVDHGDTTMDFLPDERNRGITIMSAAISFTWKDHTVFLVDSPGHLDFTYEVERALKVMDGVIVLLDAVAGVQPQTETVWRQADTNSLSRVVFVNKMDRDGVDFQQTIESVRKYFNATPAVVQVPIFENGTFRGVYDILERFEGGDLGSGLYMKNEEDNEQVGGYNDLSPRDKDAVDMAVDALLESTAEVDDDVMVDWVDGKPVSKEKILRAIRKGCISGHLVPLLCGSSLKGIGVEPLMDSIIRFLPSPSERVPVKATTNSGEEVSIPMSSSSPFLAYAFKVTHDKHRGRMVHLRAFSGSLDHLKKPFFNTNNGRMESATKLVRVLADKFVDIQQITAGDIFAATGLKHTKTGDTLVMHHGKSSQQVALDRVTAPPAVFTVALEVDTSSQEKALEEALERFVDEDASLELRTDVDTGETLLSGMGELHVEVAIDRLTRSLGFPVHASKPRVSYRETATQEQSYVANYDSQIGTNHLFARLRLDISPITNRGEENSNDISENEIFISGFAKGSEEEDAVRSGVLAGLERGPLMSAAVTGVCVKVSKEGGEKSSKMESAALRACAARGLRQAVVKAQPALLEPLVSVEIRLPTSETGTVSNDLAHPSRGGEVHNLTPTPDNQWSILTGSAPLAGVLGWATRVRSLTKGRADLSLAFDKYRRVDPAQQERILANIRGNGVTITHETA